MDHSNQKQIRIFRWICLLSLKSTGRKKSSSSSLRTYWVNFATFFCLRILLTLPIKIKVRVHKGPKKDHAEVETEIMTELETRTRKFHFYDLMPLTHGWIWLAWKRCLQAEKKVKCKWRQICIELQFISLVFLWLHYCERIINRRRWRPSEWLWGRRLWKAWRGQKWWQKTCSAQTLAAEANTENDSSICRRSQAVQQNLKKRIELCTKLYHYWALVPPSDWVYGVIGLSIRSHPQGALLGARLVMHPAQPCHVNIDEEIKAVDKCDTQQRYPSLVIFEVLFTFAGIGRVRHMFSIMHPPTFGKACREWNRDLHSSI